MPTVGRVAPNFTLNDQDGEPVELKSFRGQKVALYFYPKDATPGCTKQACNLRDNHDALTTAGIVVLGVSPDDEKKHTRFIEKQSLNFTLLCDPDHIALEKYEVWGEKSMYGRKYMGVFRKTFLIDEKGVLVAVIEKPKVSDHAAEVLSGFGVAG